MIRYIRQAKLFRSVINGAIKMQQVLCIISTHVMINNKYLFIDENDTYKPLRFLSFYTFYRIT